MVGPQGLVEVVAFRTDDSVASDSIDSILNTSHSNRPPRGGSQHRFPLLILLMDPHRKIYEFEQLWIDIETDTVRDILHAIQLSLSDRWRQDYDGLFQVRNQTFNQLIHILNVEKYGVQPLEIWVAKPWAMSAKATIQYANSLIGHLTQLKVLTYASSKDYPHSKTYGQMGTVSSTNKDGEAILTFTADAASRMYVPGGAVLRHHHAHQFVSFAPPFQPTRLEVPTTSSITALDDVASMISDIQNSSMGSSFGDSFDERDRRAVSPLNRTPEDSILEQELPLPAVSKEVMQQSSPKSIQQPQPVIPRPKPLPSVTPAVPHAAASDRLAVQAAASQHFREQPKMDQSREEPRRSRLSMLFCCRSERDEENRDAIQRQPTLETLPEWKHYWEDSASCVSAISDSRPLLLNTSSDMHIVGRNGSRTRSDWC